MTPGDMSLKIRAKDVEIDVLLAEAKRLAIQLQDTVERISETVRTYQKVKPDDE